MQSEPKKPSCSICGYSWPKPWIVQRHRTICDSFEPDTETEAEVSAFKEKKKLQVEDMFTVIKGENRRNMTECALCDYVAQVYRSGPQLKGIKSHFERFHVPTSKKRKCLLCGVGFGSTPVTRAKHLYRCPRREGRKEENKPWLRKWNNDKKTFAKREEDFILPDAALMDVTGKKDVKTEFKPKARKTSPAPKKSVPQRAAPKKRTLPVGKRPVATKRRGRSTRKVTSSPDPSEEFQTSSDEESPPFSAGATSSEESDSNEEPSVEEPRHSKSLVVKLKLSKEKLKSIVDKKVGHEVATASDSEYQVTKNRRQVPEQGPTRAKVVKASRNVSHPRQTSIDASSIPSFLERGYTPPPRFSRPFMKTPIPPPEILHEDPGYFDEAFHASSPGV